MPEHFAFCRKGGVTIIAASAIFPLHVNKGKSIAKTLSLRTDYAMNPDKTEGGQLITSYACDPRTADAEFLLSKREYEYLTGLLLQ